MSYRLAGVPLETPLINAMGSISGTNEEQIIRDVELLAATAIGAISVGSVTIEPNPGNEALYGGPVYWRDQETSATYNALRLPNIGVDALLELAPKLREVAKGKPLIFGGAILDESALGDPIGQACELVYRLSSAPASLFELNIQCTNASGTMLGYDPTQMRRLMGHINSSIQDTSGLGLKLPAYTLPEQRALVPQIAHSLRSMDTFEYVVVCNSIQAPVPLDELGRKRLATPAEVCGMSGATTAEVGREQLDMWHRHLGGVIDMVSTLGVETGKEMAARLQAKATAVSGVSYLWESASWPQATTNLLTEWAQYQTEL